MDPLPETIEVPVAELQRMQLYIQRLEQESCLEPEELMALADVPAPTPMLQPTFTFGSEHAAAATRVVAELDKWRASGTPVPEQQIIAQAICDAELGDLRRKH